MIKMISYILGKEVKWKIIGLLFLMVFGAFLELVGVSVILPFVNTIMSPETIMDNKYLAFLYNTFGLASANQLVIILAILVVIIYILKNAFLIFMYRKQFYFTFFNQRKLATNLVEDYLHQPYLFFVSKNSAEFLRNVNMDTNFCFTVVLNILQLLAEIITAIALGVYLLYTDVMITLGVFVLLGLFSLFFIKFFKNYINRLGDIKRDYEAKLYQCVLEPIGGIKEVKILHKEEYFTKEYYDVHTKYSGTTLKSNTLSAIPKPLMETVCIGSLLIMVSIKLYTEKDMSQFIPTLSVFAIAAFRLLPSFNKVTAYINTILFYRPSVKAVYSDLMSMKEAHEIRHNDEHLEIEIQYEKSIKLDNISFRYPNTDKDVLYNLTIDIPKNKSIAFIGPSGAGKTTLADILLGVIEADKGQLIVDGNIVTNIYSWQKKLGYIPQSIYLTDGNIRKNIAFGVPENEIDDDKIWKAIKQAQLEEFVKSLDLQLDSMIGERGARISGGQRQRIGIARALYFEPDVLVLDEATSSLDNETEKAVMEAIENLQGSITLIIIAHRLSTVKNCDIIYEILDGKAYLKDKNELFEDA